MAQVNDYLDDLANSNTKKDRPGVKKALQLLMRNTSALQQKWLIRIILKVLFGSHARNTHSYIHEGKVIILLFVLPWSLDVLIKIGALPQMHLGLPSTPSSLLLT